jgi:hypothetical protein
MFNKPHKNKNQTNKNRPKQKAKWYIDLASTVKGMMSCASLDGLDARNNKTKEQNKKVASPYKDM